MTTRNPNTKTRKCRKCTQAPAALAPYYYYYYYHYHYHYYYYYYYLLLLYLLTTTYYLPADCEVTANY